ncbi:Galectin-3 [Trichoplax sp. H2]|nr:Galectin-3 [Trichoplax sp. H2]|eukprot:RDD41833.1 Galectin-3 [Trichoplax sp. H2]
MSQEKNIGAINLGQGNPSAPQGQQNPQYRFQENPPAYGNQQNFPVNQGQSNPATYPGQANPAMYPGQANPAMYPGQAVPAMQQGQANPAVQLGQVNPVMYPGQAIPAVQQGQANPALYPDSNVAAINQGQQILNMNQTQINLKIDQGQQNPVVTQTEVTETYDSRNACHWVGNVFWLICGGFFLALQWALLGVAFSVTIIGIPCGLVCFKMAMLTLLPFGKDVSGINPVSREDEKSCITCCGNVLWLPFGILFAIEHFLLGLVQFITLICIPFGIQNFKLGRIALWPFGYHLTAMREKKTVTTTSTNVPANTP